MSYARTLLLATALLAGPAHADAPAPAEAAAPAAKSPFLGGFLRQTRIVYPLRVGKWQAVGEHRYDNQEAGVSVRYAHGDDQDRWIDMYFYPVGVLEESDVATLAAQERDGIRQARVKDGQGSLSDLDTFRITLPGEDGDTRLTAYALDLAYVHDDAPFNSAMTLYVHRLYATKARFSVADSVMSRGKARRMLQAFTADLAPKLEFSSTGACWSPLPIEALAQRQAPKGALFAMSKGGKEHTWVYPDRVLAVDPASPDAQAAMYLGMAATGRMSEGCESTGSFMPEVPEGMREIRIEYRAPDDGTAPAQRARANRMGVG